VTRAAGGILRRSENELRIAVVHRKRHHGDWTLPKGHLDQDESWEQAALREVLEETGCEGRILKVAEPIAYLVKDIPKVVLFFHMEFLSQRPLTDEDEVKEVVWLTPHEALERLTYPRERDLVARAFTAHGNATRRRTRRLDVKAERLQTTLTVEAPLIQMLVERTTAPSDSEFAVDWRGKALDLLSRARAALLGNRTDEGWRSLNAAQRLTIFGMLPEERSLEGRRVIEEARAKLDGWRLKAIENALAATEGKQPPTSVQLYFARELIDEHFDTLYLRLGMLERRLIQLPLLLGIVLASVFVLVALEFPAAAVESTLGSWRRFITVIVLGALGAVISATLAGLRNPLRGRLTEIMQRDAITLLRPLVGATSAAAVAIFLESGIQTTIDVNGSRVFPFALAAGFTERLVVRVMKSVEDAASNP